MSVLSFLPLCIYCHIYSIAIVSRLLERIMCSNITVIHAVSRSRDGQLSHQLSTGERTHQTERLQRNLFFYLLFSVPLSNLRHTTRLHSFRKILGDTACHQHLCLRPRSPSTVYGTYSLRGLHRIRPQIGVYPLLFSLA